MYSSLLRSNYSFPFYKNCSYMIPTFITLSSYSSTGDTLISSSHYDVHLGCKQTSNNHTFDVSSFVVLCLDKVEICRICMALQAPPLYKALIREEENLFSFITHLLTSSLIQASSDQKRYSSPYYSICCSILFLNKEN